MRAAACLLDFIAQQKAVHPGAAPRQRVCQRHRLHARDLRNAFEQLARETQLRIIVSEHATRHADAACGDIVRRKRNRYTTKLQSGLHED
jgi:hypothetical protein